MIAPIIAKTSLVVRVCGKKAAMKPANMKTTSTQSKAPPQAVKSILVCIANRVRAKTTPAVIPTAISTSFTSYVEQMAPISHPSHNVNSPRKIRLWGLFLLMEGTQTKASIMMMEKAMATQSKGGFAGRSWPPMG